MVWPIFAALGSIFAGGGAAAAGGAAAGGLASTIGGKIAIGVGTNFLASKLAGKQSTTSSNRMNFEQFRDDAIKGGFNPYSALRATGGGGGTTTTTGPNLSSQAFLQDAISGAATTWFNRKAIARDQELDMIKLDTMREELTQLKKRGQGPQTNFGWAIPNAQTGNQNEPKDPDLIEPGRRTGTNILDYGSNAFLHPGVVDAESGEARYGSFAEEGIGALNVKKDALYDARLQDLSNKYGRDVAERFHAEFSKNPSDANLKAMLKRYNAKPKSRSFTPYKAGPSNRPERTRRYQKELRLPSLYIPYGYKPNRLGLQ